MTKAGLYAQGILAIGVAVASLGALPAAAQDDYPSRPIRMIVPFGAGGGIDFTARAMSGKLSEELGQEIIVENMGGGGGSLASATVIKAEPDGYTLLYHSTTGPAQAAVRDDLPYDWFEDLVPVSQVTAFAPVMIVSPDFPAQNLKDFIQVLKDNPGKYSYASSGTGTAVHLLTELFKSKAGVDIVHIPYQGTGAAISDLIAGRVVMMIDGVPVRANDIKAGTVGGLAVTTAERSAALPDLPTMLEEGVDMVEPYWTGIFAPAGTPQAIIDELATAVGKVMRDQEVVDRLAEVGTDAVGSTAAEFDTVNRNTYTLYHDIVTENPSLLAE